MKKYGQKQKVKNESFGNWTQWFCWQYLFNALIKEKHDVRGYSKGDILSLFKSDLVFHLAAYPKVFESIKYPHTAIDNIKVTFDVLEYIRSVNCKKIIFASSTEALSLKTPYSASKLASENLIGAYCNCYGIGAVSLRFSNIYGPGDRKDRFIPTVIRKAKKGKNIDIYGNDGSFIYVDDCVKIYLDTIKLIEAGKHKIYEVTNKSESLISIAEKIVKMSGSKSKIKIDVGLKKMIKGDKK